MMFGLICMRICHVIQAKKLAGLAAHWSLATPAIEALAVSVEFFARSSIVVSKLAFWLLS